MDRSVEIVIEKRVEKVIKNLQLNNMNGYFVSDQTELHALIDNLVQDESHVTVGGSMTLFETGIIDYLRNRNLYFADRYEEDITSEAIEQIYYEAFKSDFYFASTNAITEDGAIYNVDGRGNRVAAMIYGPKKVILVVGTNKIVKDIPEAKSRNRRIAAPANVQRLSRNTPCATTGYCTDCSSPDKICHAYSIITSQMTSNRIHVIFIKGNYGY